MSFDEYLKITTIDVRICNMCGSENTTLSNYVNHPACHDCGYIDWADKWEFIAKRYSIV